MRIALACLLAACSSAATTPPDARAPAPDGASEDATVDAGALTWGERCGNGTDDDGDGLADEDCAPSLFVGMFAPAVASDPSLASIEAASGRRLSVIQTYHSLSAAGIAATGPDLTAIFARGQVAHLNIEPAGFTAAQYSTPGTLPLAAMASAIASSLAAAPSARMFVTFGAEMNGDWTDWSCLPPAQFIALHRAAHDEVAAALDARGLDHRRVRWVYGPANRSSASCGSLAGYYPGHAYVDLLGMSAYRSGADSVAATVTSPMTSLFDNLGYPPTWRKNRFVLLQTGSRDVGDRAAWVSALVSTLTADERVAGLIYFDSADWTIPTTELAPAVATPPLADRRLDGMFSPHFWDVPYDHPAFPEIEALADAKLTSGCATAPARFCPDEPLTAAAADALLTRAFPAMSADLADPVSEQDLVDTLAAAGHVIPPGTSITSARATRARAAVILAHAANLAPTPL